MEMAECPAPFAAACHCGFSGVWRSADGDVMIYPASKLLVWKDRLLLRFLEATRTLFGIHRVSAVTSFVLVPAVIDNVQTGVQLGMFSYQARGQGWAVFTLPLGVGMDRIRRLQRWLRRRVLWRKHRLAFMMGTHARLGHSSPLLCLDDGLVQHCCRVAFDV